MREYGQLILAVAFALVFAVTVGVSLAVAVWGDEKGRERLKDILQLLLPAEMALLGAATTWYFAGS